MFCANCGKEVKEGSAFCAHCGARIGGNPSGAAQDVVPHTPMPESGNMRNSDAVGKSAISSMENSGFTDQTAGIRQIIGKSEDYYLGQFDRIHREGRSRINWASFFFSLLHASYRGVWREWVKKMALPLGIEFGCMLLMALMFLIQPVVAALFVIIVMGVSVWIIIAQILFAGKFNQVYMQHVEQKLAQGDLSADPSVKRLIITGLIWGVIVAIQRVFISAAAMGGILGGLTFAGSGDISDGLDMDWSSYMEEPDTNWSSSMEDPDTEDSGISEESFPEGEKMTLNSSEEDTYHIGDTINFTSGLKLTLIDSGIYTESSLFGDGIDTYAFLEIDMENMGDEEISITGGNFLFYADGYALENVYLYKDEELPLVSTLSPGRKVKGRVYATGENIDSAESIEVELGDAVIRVYEYENVADLLNTEGETIDEYLGALYSIYGGDRHVNLYLDDAGKLCVWYGNEGADEAYYTQTYDAYAIEDHVLYGYAGDFTDEFDFLEDGIVEGHVEVLLSGYGSNHYQTYIQEEEYFGTDWREAFGFE